MGLCSAKCTSKARLDGKTAVITGASSGIGKLTAQDFYKRGAHVIVACRDPKRAEKAVADIKKACEDLEHLGSLRIVQLDLSSLKSVRDCAKDLLDNEQRIELLVNNAGVLMCPESKTEDGFETQIGTNHFGHFLFTLLLLPRICHSAPARIINVSSIAHAVGDRIDLEDLNWNRKAYNRSLAYTQSKLANVLFTKELERRLQERRISGVTTYSLHPGVVNTEIIRHAQEWLWPLRYCMRGLMRLFFMTAEQGAQTTIYCAVDEKCSKETGLYYANCRTKSPSPAALHEEDARQLWALSWKLVGLDERCDPFAAASE